jgi:ubiquinol-cytochrome c reductase cytochrome b subunit
MADNQDKGQGGLLGWIDARFPLSEFFRTQLVGYYAPKNFNFWYFFGSLALLVLVLQIVTGIFLTMNYKPSAADAFASVEYIMRDVEWGWLIRYMHSTGASFFFIVVYLHMFRGLLYGSYKAPRELLWVFGALIYLVLMGEAFMGYLLPWGQMSYWGAQVIISLFGTIPGIGPELAEWIRGDYYISDITLNRFFALHVIALPLVLCLLVVLHLVALRQVGSNNPEGIEIKKTLGPDGKPLDGIPFHPYYITKDVVGVAAFAILFSLVLFFAPEGGGYFLEAPNFEPANQLKTPEHIVPVWYFTPYYAMLRAIPPIGVSQFPGVAVMGLAVLILFFLPWIDRHPVKSVRYRGPLFRSLLMLFAATFLVLGWLGTLPATPFYSEFAFRLTELYFGFFVVLFVYSSPRTPVQMHLFTAVSLGFVLLADLARFWAVGFDQVHDFQWILMILPLAFAAIYMQAPIHTRWNDALPVPERITK